GSSHASDISAPGNVTATGGAAQSPVSVPVSWDASHVGSGNAGADAQITYSIDRSTDGGSTWSSAGGTCSGNVSGTSCSDSVTQSGSYTYRVTASLNSWKASGTSSAVTVYALSQPTLDSQPADPSATAAPTC